MTLTIKFTVSFKAYHHDTAPENTRVFTGCYNVVHARSVLKFIPQDGIVKNEYSLVEGEVYECLCQVRSLNQEENVN